MEAILGKKLKMSQVFSQDGERFPVTEIMAGPCRVAFEKTQAKDGYQAVGLSLEIDSKAKEKKVVREIRVLEEDQKIPPGSILTVDQIFKKGDLVDIQGLSKGLGFTGVVKRHHFKGGPRTHGQSDRERAPGSVGSTTTPGRVLKGKKMAGKVSKKKVTVKNLQVIWVDGKTNRLLVRGAVPGKAKGILLIKKTGKETKFEKELIIN